MTFNPEKPFTREFRFVQIGLPTVLPVSEDNPEWLIGGAEYDRFNAHFNQEVPGADWEFLAVIVPPGYKTTGVLLFAKWENLLEDTPTT